MFTFYFAGHDFEYECLNALRMFDLNTEFEIKDESELHNNKGLGLLTSLNEIIGDNGDVSEESYVVREGSAAALTEYVAEARLYMDDVLLHEAQISSKDIILETKNDKKLKKTIVSKSIHNVLKSYYKVKTDYGILTGVRPVKILFTAKKSGKSADEINRIFEDTYELSQDRIKLLWEVADIEEKYIDENLRMKNYDLYIGIPFCPSKCSYCSFTSFVNCRSEAVEKYLRTLSYEIEKTIETALEHKLKLNTVYFGGGTPSVLNENQIDNIFASLKKYYDLSKLKEITFEAGRPDTITQKKLECLRENLVSRISINPQTMNQTTLDAIGRKHTVGDITDKYNLARKMCFNSINMDIILGLPGENERDVLKTIDEIIDLRPDNITVHALAYKSKSALTRESSEHLSEYNLLKKMQRIVEDRCLNSGYKPYYMYRQKNIKGNLENVGYTLPGKECIYNIEIIEECETILACGCGVSSKIMINGERHEPLHGFKSLEDYNARIEETIEKKKRLMEIRNM
jgi:oxygen-independent coproporphyrinogen-3 oxidase